MNPFKKPVLQIVAALAFGAAAMGAWAAYTADSADVAALQAVTQSWVQAYNAGDADAVSALYADDATLMPPDNSSAVGKAAIRNFFITDIGASQHAGYKFSITGTSGDGVAGDWGWLSGSYTVADAAGHAVDGGKFLSVFKKVDGKWLLLRDTWNSDNPKK